jgi:hypothetical protein
VAQRDGRDELAKLADLRRVVPGQVGLFVHSDGCVFPEHIETLRSRMRGPVDVVWGEGAQTDFYDQPDQVAFACDALEPHFLATLTPT